MPPPTTMKKLYSPLTLSGAGKEMTVTGYTLPQPPHFFSDHHRWEESNMYLESESVKVFLASKVTCMVQEESKEHLMSTVYDYWDKCEASVLPAKEVFHGKLFTEAITNGIDISYLADMLELYEEKRYSNACNWPECTYKDCTDKHVYDWGKKPAYFVRLLPEKKYPIAGFAHGIYSCTCCICKKNFMGDKRAVMCKHCAISKLTGSGH